MSHLSEQDLTALYYREAEPQVSAHVNHCALCRAEFERLRSLLDLLRESPAPEPRRGFELDVWNRLVPILSAAEPDEKQSGGWFRWWLLTPVTAALLVLVFWAGMVTQQHGGLPGISPKSSDRVLLITMGEHLDRSQILLTELVNSRAGSADVPGDREAARELLGENRLLRAAAVRSGANARAALLEELERVLLDIANQPGDVSPAEVQSVLFKIRIVSSNVRKQVREI